MAKIAEKKKIFGLEVLEVSVVFTAGTTNIYSSTEFFF